jgi:hypothetical protein
MKQPADAMLANETGMGKLVALIAVIAVGVTAACSDAPAPSAKGTRAVGGETQEIGEARPAPNTERGVVPDLTEVTVADSRKALADAGFETGQVETTALFGTVGGALLVCSQSPQAGATPRRGTKVNLVADRQC